MKRLLLVLAAVLVLPSAARAVLIVPSECTVDKQVDTATHIIYGTCTASEVKESAGRTLSGTGSTTYTFKVTEDVKGNIGKETFTFRSAGTTRTKWAVHLKCDEKAPTEYLLMLTCSPETEFCSTVCFTAGRYEAKTDASGKRTIRSTMSRGMLFDPAFQQRNAAVMKSLPARERDMITRTDAKEDMDRDDFVGVVKRLAEERNKRNK
jgi:hypothetical protein